MAKSRKPLDEQLADAFIDIFRVYLGNPSPKQIDFMRDKAKTLAVAVVTGSTTAAVDVCKKLQGATVKAFQAVEGEIGKIKDKQEADTKMVMDKAETEIESLRNKHRELSDSLSLNQAKRELVEREIETSVQELKRNRPTPRVDTSDLDEAQAALEGEEDD